MGRGNINDFQARHMVSPYVCGEEFLTFGFGGGQQFRGGHLSKVLLTTRRFFVLVFFMTDRKPQIFFARACITSVEQDDKTHAKNKSFVSLFTFSAMFVSGIVLWVPF